MNKSDGTGTLGLKDLLRLRGRGSRGRGRVYRSLLLVILFETAESLGLVCLGSLAASGQGE